MTRQVRLDVGRAWLGADEAAVLGPGSELLLERPAGGEAEIYADAVRIATGTLAAIDGKFCVKVSEVRDCGLSRGMGVSPMSPTGVSPVA
jgi:flagellar motor switch/type III secretory pathway protein FliN